MRYTRHAGGVGRGGHDGEFWASFEICARERRESEESPAARTCESGRQTLTSAPLTVATSSAMLKCWRVSTVGAGRRLLKVFF